MPDPIFSPDGKWMWTGSEWIPAPPQEMNAKPSGINDSVIMGDVVSNIEISTNSLSKAELLYSEAKKNEEQKDFTNAIRLFELSLRERNANEEEIIAHTKYRIGICYAFTDGNKTMINYFIEHFDEIEKHLKTRELLNFYHYTLMEDNSMFERIFAAMISVYEKNRIGGKWKETFESILFGLLNRFDLHSNHSLVLEILDHWFRWDPDFEEYFRIINSSFLHIGVALDLKKTPPPIVTAFCHLGISILKMLERQYPIYRGTFDQTLPNLPLDVAPSSENWNSFQDFARRLQHYTLISGPGVEPLKLDFPFLLFYSMSYYTDILYTQT